VDAARSPGLRHPQGSEIVRSSRSPAFHDPREVVDANAFVHELAETPLGHCLEQPGLLEHALERAEVAYWAAPSEPNGVALAAAHLAHGIAAAQAFRDGNRRTAYVVSRTFLANNGFGHLSDLGHEDQQLSRYLKATVDSHGARYPLAAYERLFTGRLYNRRRIH
jgi:prophage maintenance system killer protein